MSAVIAAEISQILLAAYEPWQEQLTAAKKAVFDAKKTIRTIEAAGGTAGAEDIAVIDAQQSIIQKAQAEIDDLGANPWYKGYIEHQWEKARESGSCTYINTYFILPDGKRVPTVVRGDAKQGDFIKPLDPSDAGEMSEKLGFKIWTRKFDGSLAVKRYLGPDEAEDVEVDGRVRRVPKDAAAMKAGGQSPLFVALWLLDEANTHEIQQRIKSGLIISKDDADKLRKEALEVGEDPNSVVSASAMVVPTLSLSSTTEFCYSDKSHYGANAPRPNPLTRISFKMDKVGELPSGPPRPFGKNKTPSCAYFDYDGYKELVAKWEAAGGADSGEPKPAPPPLLVDGQPITGMNIHRAVPRGAECIVVAKKDAICVSNMSISSPCSAKTIMVSKPATGGAYGEIDPAELAAEMAGLLGGGGGGGAAAVNATTAHLADLGLE